VQVNGLSEGGGEASDSLIPNGGGVGGGLMVGVGGCVVGGEGVEGGVGWFFS